MSYELFLPSLCVFNYYFLFTFLVFTFAQLFALLSSSFKAFMLIFSLLKTGVQFTGC
jgi:hypothetical protein